MSLRGISIETVRLPPLHWAAQRVYGRLRGRQRRRNHYCSLYPNNANAMPLIPKNTMVGFDNQSPANKYCHRIHEPMVSEHLALWISRLTDHQQWRFFDLDGQFGLFYCALQRYRRLHHDRHWMICGLPIVIRPGKE